MRADQCSYDTKTISRLHGFAEFLILFYIPVWLKSSIATEAAINDLNFSQNMLQYKAYDENVGQAAFQKLLKHIWYLTEENMIFTLFSCNEASSNKTKPEIADQLCLMPHPDEF